MADALDPANASKATLKLENVFSPSNSRFLTAANTLNPTLQTEKRDTLVAIEKKYQQFWADNHVFETNAPTMDEDPTTDPDTLREHHPKFFGCMAYPYMNGTLHAGHSFSLSKVEFQTGYARMQGKRALFPLGFHCTGMPIKACADKLKRSISS
jgi:leucyl-tRNA synthetase